MSITLNCLVLTSLGSELFVLSIGTHWWRSTPEWSLQNVVRQLSHSTGRKSSCLQSLWAHCLPKFGNSIVAESNLRIEVAEAKDCR